MRVSAAIHTSGTVNINILFFNVKTPGKLLLCIGGGGGGGKETSGCFGCFPNIVSHLLTKLMGKQTCPSKRRKQALEQVVVSPYSETMV